MGNNNTSALREEEEGKPSREYVGADDESQEHPILESQAKDEDLGLVTIDQKCQLDGRTKDGKEENGVHLSNESPETELNGLANHKETDSGSSESHSATISLQHETETLAEEDRARKHEEPADNRQEPAKDDLYGQSEQNDGLLNTETSSSLTKKSLSDLSTEPEKQSDELSVQETKSAEPNSSKFEISDGLGENVTETQDLAVGLEMVEEQLRNEGEEDTLKKIKDLENESIVSVEKGFVDNLGCKQEILIENGVQDEEEPEIVSDLEVNRNEEKDEKNKKRVNFMFRSRSLPVRRTKNILTSSLVQEVSSSSKKDIKEEESKKLLEAKVAENPTIQVNVERQSVEPEQEDVNVHDKIMKFPSFGMDLQIEAVKTHIEEKIVTLDQNESEKLKMENHINHKNTDRPTSESEQEDIEVHDKIKKSPSFGIDLSKSYVEEKIVTLDRNGSKKSKMKSDSNQENAGIPTIESEQEDKDVHDKIRKPPSFGLDLRIEAGKSHVEEKTVTLDRNGSEKLRMKEELEGFLEDKKVEKGSSKGKEKRRAKASVLGTCLCCAAVIN